MLAVMALNASITAEVTKIDTDRYILYNDSKISFGGNYMKYQTFDGIQFVLDEKTGYYKHSTLRKYLHRYVWEYYNGKIPSGYEIHHIDFDKSNNDISNLQLLSHREHKKLHADLLTEQQREWRRQNLTKMARPKASEWHKSKDGRDWHSVHVKQQHESGQFKRELICTQCGTKYIGELHKIGGNSFCSNKCKSAYRRLHGLNNITKVCPICGKEFATDKYAPTMTCSRSCANRFKWNNRRGN